MDIPAGTWKGTVRTWFHPGADTIHSAMTATSERVLDGKCIHVAYRSTVNESRADGWMIFGTDIETSRLSLTWIDTFHTGSNMMHFAAGEDGDLRGAYAAGEELWRWRIAIQSTDNELRLDHFNITPAGEEAHAIEVVLRRA